MDSTKNEDTAYAFSLDDTQRSYIYYRTVSRFTGSFAAHGRDQRKADPVIASNFKHVMDSLNQPFQWVRDDGELRDWEAGYGWALVQNDYAKLRLSALLDSRTCVKSAIGLFWDVALPRNRAASRRIARDVRRKVLQRDGNRCIECRTREADGAQLTMDHVIPFSRGGETAEGNLVTLCESCNQTHGNADHPHLFVLAGLDHGWDPCLLHDGITSDPDAKFFAMMLSQNIMVSRCRVDQLSGPGHRLRGTV